MFENSSNKFENFSELVLESEGLKFNSIFAIIEVVIATCAVLENLIVILIYFRENKFKTRIFGFVISLSFADFLCGLVAIPFELLVRYLS